MQPQLGLIYRSTGSWYQVWIPAESRMIDARTRGKMRLEEQQLTNPIAVGDWVQLLKMEDASYVIENYEERKNVLIRKSVKKTDHAQIIAANIDQALCIQSIRKPMPKEGFIDRFLVTCEAYEITPIVLFTKTDLARKKDITLLEEYIERYQSLGYKTLSCSIQDPKSIEIVKEVLMDKTTVLTGHSGVGKSTLLNQLDDQLSLKTGAISDFNQKGMHTTTFATMFDLSFGGRVIDTPGIKEFGLYNISVDELALYFKDFDSYRNQCKYDNCSHIHEPGCKVIEALEEGRLDPFRYDSYVRIYESLENES